MSIESLLFTSLTGNSGLRSLISARLYPDVLPQGATLPAVVYQRISTPRQHTFGAGCPVAVSRPRLQYACWAATPAAALAVCEALRSALQASGYAVTFDSETTMREPESGLYVRYLDAFVAHTGA